MYFGSSSYYTPPYQSNHHQPEEQHDGYFYPQQHTSSFFAPQHLRQYTMIHTGNDASSAFPEPSAPPLPSPIVPGSSTTTGGGAPMRWTLPGIRPDIKGLNTDMDSAEKARILHEFDDLSYFLNLFFDPWMVPMRCVNSQNESIFEAGGAMNTNSSYDITMCNSGITITGPRAVKLGLIFLALLFYVFALVWIVAIYEGFQACNLGLCLVSSSSSNNNNNNNSTATAAAAAATTAATFSSLSGNCTFQPTGLAEMNVEAYVNFRLAIYLVSAFPVLYLCIMTVVHLQQGANYILKQILYSPDEIKQQQKPTIDRNSSFITIFMSSMSSFEARNVHLTWLSLLVLLNLALGVAALSMDWSMAGELGKNWHEGNACYELEQVLPKYQSGARIPIKDLPIALSVPCVVYTVWAFLFLVNEIMKFIFTQAMSGQ